MRSNSFRELVDLYIRTLKALEGFGEVWPVDAIEGAITTYYKALDVAVNTDTQSEGALEPCLHELHSMLFFNASVFP